MGVGIQTRYGRCRKYWEPHLRFTKEFQLRALSLLNTERIESALVLGAGRLLDVPLEELSECVKTVHLLDYDPGAVQSWGRRPASPLGSAKIVAHHGDVSGSIEAWTTTLERWLTGSHARPSANEVASYLDALVLRPPYPLPLAEVVISTNLLSQIAVYWRDRAIRLIERATELRTDDNGEFGAPVQGALIRSMARLQEQHLTMLDHSGAGLVVIITDLVFLYYEREQSPWMAEEALVNGRGVVLDHYKRHRREAWFWHIAPQGIEEKKYGSIHEVEASAWLRQRA